MFEPTWKDRYRKLWSQAHLVGIFGLACIAAIPFLAISYYVFQKGVDALNWDFFTQLPKGPGEAGGGMANAIVGSAKMVGLACLISVPWGILVGAYLSEFGRGKTAWFLRLTIDLLASVPSIVVGIFIYSLLVIHFGFSAWAGASALSVIMLPVVARTSEEILQLLPKHYREAGLALGLPRWKVICFLVLPACLKGITMGVMLALARAAGETAPLLFTALGNQYFASRLSEATASLPVQIYNFAISPYPEMQRQAWAGALVLVGFVVAINLVSRWALRRAA